MTKKEKREKQLRRRRMRRLMIVWSLLGLLGLLWMMSLLIRLVAGLLVGDEGKKADENGAYISPMQVVIPQFGEDGLVSSGEERKTDLRERCQSLYEAAPELLVLVNWERELESEDYEDSLRSICNGRLQASHYLYDDLVDMLAAAGEEGYHYWIASAYRSRQRQQELVDEDVLRYRNQGLSYQKALEETYKQTMPAGKSEHETGLALDILYGENPQMDLSQADTAGNQWLVEHSHEYGFILRYPQDGEEITGIAYEPWHFRYVGKEAAQFLYENQLTLEEFHNYLENNY